MKGYIFDIKRFAVHDGSGVRTTVFFKGCPLSCAWCHNPESREEGISKIEKCYKIEDAEKTYVENVGKRIHVQELRDELLKDLYVMEESEGGITISGGEPLHQFEFLKSLLKELKEAHVHTCVDTTGYANGDRFADILPYTDLFLFDLKHYDEEKHIEHTGVSIQPIVKNLNTVLEKNRDLWLRIPIIPNVNDSHEDKYGFLYKLSELVRKPDQIHLLPYHNLGVNKYVSLKYENSFKDVPSVKPNVLKPFKNMLEREGYSVKIGT